MQAVSFGKSRVKKIAVAAIILTAIVALFSAGAIHRQLDAWKLLPQPERLTELYYANHTKLPTTYTAGVPQQFSFITHNLEYQDADYTYAVTQTSEDGKTVQPITSGKFNLRDDTIGTTPVTFTPAELGKRSMIVTTLTNTGTHQSQSIHYWVTNTAPIPAQEGDAS